MAVIKDMATTVEGEKEFIDGDEISLICAKLNLKRQLKAILTPFLQPP